MKIRFGLLRPRHCTEPLGNTVQPRQVPWGRSARRKCGLESGRCGAARP